MTGKQKAVITVVFKNQMDHSTIVVLVHMVSVLICLHARLTHVIGF